MKKIRVPSAIVGFAFGLSLLTAPFTSHADNLFVCSGGGFDQTIKEFNSAGIGTPFASTSFGNPWGMAFDSTGSLYVTYQSYNTIEKFNSSGGVLSGSGTVFAAGIVSPWSLAFDSTGNLYVTTQSLNSGVNSTIEKYS
jgi:secreted PhoX family phosphatase